jgi:5-methylcytosine-specific restriction endonuclease McrA
MTEQRTLTTISDEALLRRLRELLCESRRTESDLVAHIGEVDARRLYAREASPSMFSYCTRMLHLSGAEAYLRIAAARAAREHPVLLAMLADGRLHLSAIAKLAPHLTRENRDLILSRATHRSKRQIEELIAEIRPLPDVPSLMRRLPERARHVALPSSALIGARGDGAAPVQADCTGQLLRPDGVRAQPSTELACHEGSEGAPVSGLLSDKAGLAELLEPETPRGPSAETRGTLGEPRETLREISRPSSRCVVEPLAPSRYKVQFTASAELRDKLERLQALLRSDIPDGDLGAVVDRAVTETLQRLEARRYAKRTAPRHATRTSQRATSTRRLTSDRAAVPRSSTTPSQGAFEHSRHIPAAIRRAVYERDRGRCRYVDDTGRRCPERDRLEYHHRYPFGMGGGHTIENVRLMCRTHNLYLAEHDYGRKTMAAYRNPIQKFDASEGHDVTA